MSIVCLGWGSLVWQPRGLPILCRWHENGPSLPLEFARQSMDGRITLVVANSDSVSSVLWAELGVATLDEARRTLALREGPGENLNRVAFWSRTNASPRQETKAIEMWALENGVEAVVWTALAPKFNRINGRTPSQEEVIAYLRELNGEQRQRAEEYVRLAPTKIRTRYRAAIEKEFGWISSPPGRTIDRPMTIDAEAWGFQHIRTADEARADRLDSAGTRDDLVASLTEALYNAVAGGDVRLAVDAKDDRFEQLRVIIQFKVSADLYDCFFNGRTGYRAQFWSDPEAGMSFNRRIVEALSEVLRRSLPTSVAVRMIRVVTDGIYREERDVGSKKMDREQLLTSLCPKASKIWICERLYSMNGEQPKDIGFAALGAANAAAKLCVPRWAEVENPDTHEKGEGLRAPCPHAEYSWIDLKGGFVDGSCKVSQPKPQEERATQIHEYGWTWAAAAQPRT